MGIDEVGRGSLIGAVVAGAVALPATLSPAALEQLAALNDSKRLSPATRARLCDWLLENAFVGVGRAEQAEVETLNVYHASLLASHRAYLDCLTKLSKRFPEQSPPLVLIDGRATLPQLPAGQQQAIVKGDGLSAAIAAASVVAKHLRDSEMLKLAREFPQYGWEDNMGYGAPAHLAALRQYGPTPYHRRNYKPVQTAQFASS